MKGHRFIIGCVVLALLVLAPQSLLAQSSASKGQIFGTATDPEGAVMPGVTVVATNSDSGFSRSAVSDASGFYRMDLMPVGNYEIKATLTGFQTQIYRDAYVALGSSLRMDFAMALSAIEEEIVVTAEAPVVETTNPNASASVSDEQIANLPLNGRDFTDFALLTPGATYGDTNAVQGARGGLNVGARAIQNSFNIDGANNQSSFFGEERGGTRPPFTFSQAAIKELQVVKSDYGTQFSSSGAVINAITKSGTNSFSGELWTYYTNDSMVSATAGNDQVDSREPNEQSQLQYGFAIGGPIVRDKLHFFASVDAQDYKIPMFVNFDEFPIRPHGRLGSPHRTRLRDRDRRTDDSHRFRRDRDHQRRAGLPRQARLAARRRQPPDHPRQLLHPGRQEPDLGLRQHRPFQQRSRGEQLQLAGRVTSTR